MATISVPGRRQEPDFNLIGDTALNEEPKFPFRVYPKNGYLSASVNPEYDPAVLPVEILFTLPMSPDTGWGTGWNFILGVMQSSIPVLIGLYHIQVYGDGLSNPPTAFADYGAPLLYKAGRMYKMRFTAFNKDSLRVQTYDNTDGTMIGTMNLVVTDIFAGSNPTMNFGYLPLSHRNADTGEPGQSWDILEDVVIHEIRRPGEPTGITMLPMNIPVATANKTVAKFSTTHTYPTNEKFRYVLYAGTGGTHNSLFTIVGDELVSKAQLESGVRSIRVRSYDIFNRTFTTPILFGVGASAPSDIALDPYTNEAGGGQTLVGTLTVVDADPGDTSVYTLVAGTGDTDNALFEILNDNELHFLVAPDAVAQYSIRLRATDSLGMSREEAMTVIVEDTNAPAITDWTVNEPDSTYDVDCTIVLTHEPGIGSLEVTMLGRGETPDANTVWYPYLIPTTISIPEHLRTGAGTYALDGFARDESGNVSAAFEFSADIVDTVAPVLTAVPSPVIHDTLTVSISGSEFTHTHAAGFGPVYFIVTETDVQPLVGDPGWAPAAGTVSYTIPAPTNTTTYTAYAWAKDDAGNITATSNEMTITVRPAVTAFDVPATASSYTFDVNTFTAVDIVAILGQMITETNVRPTDVNDPRWVLNAPPLATYTIVDQVGSGDYTLYAWTMNESGHISMGGVSDTITLTIA